MDSCNLRTSHRHFKDYSYISCHLSTNAQEMVKGKESEKVEGKKKTALVAKWVHLLITMAVAVFPLVVGTHETFRSLRGLRKHQRLATLSPLTQLGSNGA